MEYIGIDGCRSGWFCVELGQTSEWQFQVVSKTEKLSELVAGAKWVLIDIPIGLIDIGSEERICDKEARRVLGRRGSSVFPAPARPSLDAASREEASALNHDLTGRKLSQQSWAISTKIREIDQMMRSHIGLQRKLRECHPEVCFWALNNGQPMNNRKKIRAGREERLAVLTRYLPQAGEILETTGKRFLRKEVAWDDIVDALVAAVTAKLGHEQLLTLPVDPPVDEYGLAMEMVYANPHKFR